MPRSEVRGLLKDAVPIYLLDAALASVRRPLVVPR
jgi:hypothetical protein